MGGNIFVISAPSGTGKTTVVKKLLEACPGLALAVSYTTREPRSGETDGVDYKFIKKPEFEKMVKVGRFVEWAEVHGHLYGTMKNDIERATVEGKNILLDIDTKGALKVRSKFEDAILIFLLPPSLDELRKRLEKRGTDSKEDLEKRIANAKGEMELRHEYDYQVINEDVDEAFDEVLELINHYTEEVQ